MNEDLKRKLCIGFLDIPIEQRKKLIFSDESLKEVEKTFPQVDFLKNDAEQVVAWLDRNPDGKIWWCTDKFYPDFTGIENHLPYMLFVKGRIPAAEIPVLSVVGTRRASYRGLNAAFELGLEAGFNGYSVVSGMAEGCDQAASLGCLCSDSPCLEVLGCGLDVAYPSLTSNLRKRVVDGGGCLISRFAPSMPPLKQNFPNRNVIIAALGVLTIVVQAPNKSGALQTADFAVQLGKDVFVSKTAMEQMFCCRGSNKLEYDGCPAVEHISDLDSFASVRAVSAEDGKIRFQDRHYVLKNCL